MSQALITCQDLTLGYETGVAVGGLNFSVNPGDYLCVVGENGSGKSTLIKGLLGLLPPLAGSIRFGGITPRQIGYLPQQSPVQKDFPASVQEVVLSGCLGRRGSRPFYTRADKKRTQESMERLDIGDLARHCYRNLSGGQQQRVLLARALCAASKLILLDEPVTGLDPLASAGLYAIIKELNRNQGVTIIMVSHDVSCALHDATMVLHLSDKGMAFFGTAEEYHHSPVSQPFLRCDCVGHHNSHWCNASCGDGEK